MWYDFDWKGAAESLRRAQKVAATDPDVLEAAANVAYTFGQTEKAVELARQAVTLDPVNAEMRIVLGFALETDHRVENAVEKMARKHMDWIVANGETNLGGSMADGTLLSRWGHRVPLGKMKKPKLAGKLWQTILKKN
jgi:phosphopantothenoylcysteine synthetase/decarboxylase